MSELLPAFVRPKTLIKPDFTLFCIFYYLKNLFDYFWVQNFARMVRQNHSMRIFYVNFMTAFLPVNNEVILQKQSFGVFGGKFW